MQIIDLSWPIGESFTSDSTLPPFPGDPYLRLTDFCSMENDGCRVSEVRMSLHHGTHIDMPSHFISQGETVNDFPVDLFTGHCELIDLTTVTRHPLPAKTVIDIEMLLPHKDVFNRAERIVLRTGWAETLVNTMPIVSSPDACDSDTQTNYFNDSPEISPGAARWITEHSNLRLIGIDFASPSVSHCAEVHKILLEADPPVLILENLRKVEQLPERFVLSALPLRIEKAEASPVRAIGIVD